MKTKRSGVSAKASASDSGHYAEAKTLSEGVSAKVDASDSECYAETKIAPSKIAESGSFKRQIILTFVVGFFFLAAAFAAYQVKTESAYLYRDSTDETVSLAESLAASSRSWVLANDVAGLQEVVHSFVSHPELRYAVVISPSGKVLAHSDATKVGQFVSDEASLALIKSPPENRVMVDDESLSDVAVPIMVDHRHVGWARVAQGREGITNNLHNMMLSSALFVLMAVVLSLFAALLIANRLGYRIGYLMRLAEEVQAGNYAMRANISGGDEIARLANRFNHMLDVLAQDEEQLRAASLYTRSLIEASLDPLVTISPEGKITDVNKATEEITGRSRSELVGADFSDYFTEPDKAREGYRQVFAKGFVTNYPLTLRHSDGHITDVLYNASVYRNKAGEVLGVFAAARDITQRKQAEIALRNSESRYRLLVESSPMCIHEIGMDGRISSMNRAGLVMMGVEQECKVQGFLYLDAVCDADRERIGELLAKAYAGEASYFEFMASGPGNLIFKSCFVPIKNQNGSVEKLMGITEDITERKLAETSLREQTDFLHAIFESLLDAFVLIDSSGIIIDWSRQAEQTFGWTKTETVGRTLQEIIIPPRYRESHTHGMEHFLISGEGPLLNSLTETFALHRDGHEFPIELSIVPLKKGGGYEFSAFARDITERKKAEDSIREKEERLALATVNNGVGIWDWNLQTQEMIWDDSMFALYHIRREDFIGTEEAWRASLHPDDLTRGDQEVADAIAGKKPFETEFRVVWPNGEIRYIKAVAKVFRDDHGTPLRMLGINMDVTDRNKAEMELRESEDKFKYVFDHSPIGKTLTLPSGELQVNQAFCEMLGYSAEELGHSRWQDITHPDDIELTQRSIDQLLSEERDSVRFVKRYFHKSGSVVWVDIVTSLRRDEERHPLYFMTNVIDITERKRAEGILQARLRLLEFSGSHSMDELLTATLDEIEALTGSTIGFYHFVESDQKTLSLQSWSTNTLKNMCTAEGKGSHYDIDLAGVWVDCVHERHPVIHNDYASLPHRKGMPEGHAPVIRELVVPILRGDKIMSIIGVGNKPSNYDEIDIKIVSQLGDLSWDITERRRAEEKVKVLNRELESRVRARTADLEAANKELEAFSYSVSHDLRTPLRAIDGFSHILLDDYTDKLDDEGKRLLNVVRDNTNRMGQLIDDILKFSRTSRLEMTYAEIDMERLAHEVVEELRPAGGKLQVEVEHLPLSTGDRAMMHQVFVNLLSNAIKFSRAKDIPIIKVGGYIKDGEAVYFVRDNGAGFDMQFADKLFGVFQRLHAVSEFEGTGIGLAIVKRIITRHGGRVWADGKVNEGATIYFALPANQGEKS